MTNATPCYCYWTNCLVYFLSQVWCLKEERDFPLQSVLTGSSSHSASCSVGSRVKVTRAYSWPQSSVESKTKWCYTSTPAYAFMLWGLINHREHGPLQRSLFSAYCVVLNNVSITKTPTAFIKAIKHTNAVGVLIVPIIYLAWKWITSLWHHHVEYFYISICTVEPAD